MSRLCYESAGVDYDVLDAFKRACQREAATTVGALADQGLSEPSGIRGESAYLIETTDSFIAHVEEGLGTKNLVADAMANLTERCFYGNIGIDTVATIVNDLITTGARPITVAMHAAAGDSNWFADQRRAAELARGFAEGCRRAGAVWGGGETPALRGVVNPAAIVLAGSAVGQIKPKSDRILPAELRGGDAIVFLASSGVHTNGLTLCRTLAERLPDGYLSKLDDGRTFGEVLLDPSAIYANFIVACQREKLKLRYVVHMTGHGWRKLMRAGEPFVYDVRADGREPQAVFRFIQTAGPVEADEMYATFNMGVGLAVFVRPADADRCIALAKSCRHDAWAGGNVRKEGAKKAVRIAPLGIEFDEASLRVR